MAIQKKEVEYAKEVDDVMVLVVELVKNRKQGAEITELMDELLNALTGIDQVDDEFKANRKALMQTVGYRLGDLVDAFLPAEVVPVPA